MRYFHNKLNKQLITAKTDPDLANFKEIGIFEYNVLKARYKEEKKQNSEEITLRWYQEEAVEKTFNLIKNSFDKNPIIVIPTGAGKTIVCCSLIDKIISYRPASNILVLSHISDILEQNQKAIELYFDGIEVGLYSAGLDSKTIKKITVAGIQSAYRRPELFKHFDYAIIDECHLVNIERAGMYRNFLKRIAVRVIGLTATHYRLGQGYLHKGKLSIFNCISYNLTSIENFNRLIKENYLCNLITLPTKNEMDTKGVKMLGGDFSNEALAKKFNRDEITKPICEEILKYGKKYRKWLIFAIDIEHAENIKTILLDAGISCEAVHSKMGADKKEVMRKFRGSELRCLINVNMLSTGVDVPDIDLIAHLRSTKSPVFHVQSNGRGLRVHPLKDHCLILDFAGNAKRLGPINDVKVRQPGDKKGGKGAPLVKQCPVEECGALTHLSKKECDCCGYIWPEKPKLFRNASNADIVTDGNKPKIEQWLDVKSVSYNIHKKRGAADSLRVNYSCSKYARYSEWVPIDHDNRFVVERAHNWILCRVPHNTPVPRNLNALWAIRHLLKQPKQILVEIGGNFPRVKAAKF